MQQASALLTTVSWDFLSHWMVGWAGGGTACSILRLNGTSVVAHTAQREFLGIPVHSASTVMMPVNITGNAFFLMFSSACGIRIGSTLHPGRRRDPEICWAPKQSEQSRIWANYSEFGRGHPSF